MKSLKLAIFAAAVMALGAVTPGRAIAQDKYAMFYVSPMTLSPDMKELAIQAYDGGPYVKRSLETVHDRTFPTYGRYFFYFNREPGKPVDPKVLEKLLADPLEDGGDNAMHQLRSA